MQDSFTYHVFEFAGGCFKKTAIKAIQEIPLTVYLNKREVVTLLCTGKDPAPLAVGFLKSDGLLTDPKELKEVQIKKEPGRLVAHVFTTHYPLAKYQVNRAITSGCGKGINFAENLKEIGRVPMTSTMRITPEKLFALMDALNKRSSLYRVTGGCHNTALAVSDRLMIFYEDLGRHNAIDMIHGRTVLDDIQTHDKLILTTGRVASEILIKALRIGVPILVSRSAATRLAIDLAQKTNMTLIGYMRGQRMTVYNHAGRIKGLP